jgi:hypothetical protein
LALAAAEFVASPPVLAKAAARDRQEEFEAYLKCGTPTEALAASASASAAAAIAARPATIIPRIRESPVVRSAMVNLT